MAEAAAPLILEAEHLSKRFGAVTALRDVSLRLHRGEVLGLVGDNGAGKSTLIKILSGFHKPDSGTYSFDGKPVNLSSPIEARALGIQTVYQDLALVNDLSVYHNMFLGRERKKRILGLPLLDNRTMRRLTVEYLSNLGIRIPNVDNTVSMLSGGQRQSIAVARSIYSNPTVLIMDEPLAALGVRESRRVTGEHRIETADKFVVCAKPGSPHTASFLICDCCGCADELIDRNPGPHPGGRAGFRVRSILLEMRGLCRNCRE